MIATARTRRAVGLVVLAAMVLAACGSDDKSTSATGKTTTTAEQAAKIPGDKDPATGAPVKVGFTTSEGGASSLPETREAAEAAVAYANDYLGGLNGHKIDLVSCKDKGDGASGTACANQFVQEKVVAVVVGQLANAELYVPILEAASIPFVINAGAGSGSLTSPISFSITGGFVGALGAMAKLGKEEGLKKAVIFGIDVPAFTAGFGALGKPAFDKAGIETKVVTIPPGTPDATSQVTAGMAENPDMVVSVTDGALCKAVLPSIHDLNTSGAKLIVGDTCLDPDVLSTVGKDAVEGATSYNVSASLGDDDEGTLYKAVMATYRPDTSVQGKAGSGYTSMLDLVRAVNQVKPTELTAATVLDAMRTAKEVPMAGVHGATFTCDSKAYPVLKALCSVGVLFATVKDGKPTDYRNIDGSEFLK